MFGAAASPIGWNWNLISRDRDRLLATVGVPVGLDDGVLNGGPIGVGRSVLAGRSVLGGVVPPFGVLATDGTRFAVQRDWFGMASIYVYRSHGVVAFSNRPMLLLPYVFGDPIHPDAESFTRLWPATDLLRFGLSGGRDSRLLAANLLADGISSQFYTNTENPEEGWSRAG